MYELAAKAMGVKPEDCTYVSENLQEVLGAINAGMSGVVKKFRPAATTCARTSSAARSRPPRAAA